MTDPLIDAFLGPTKRVSRPEYRREAIVPAMAMREQNACLAEIRRTPPAQLAHWRMLRNGMTAGEFAWLYVHQYRKRRNEQQQARYEEQRG